MSDYNFKKAIGNRIKTLLAEQNKTQKQLAETINVKPNIISYFCNGTRTPNTEQIVKIADYFQVSADYLLCRTNVKAVDTDIRKEVLKMDKTKEKEPAPEATGTSSANNNYAYLNDSTVIKLCQDALLKIGDRIVECDGDSYILGYVHSTLDTIERLMEEDE